MFSLYTPPFLQKYSLNATLENAVKGKMLHKILFSLDLFLKFGLLLGTIGQHQKQVVFLIICFKFFSLFLYSYFLK